VEPFAAETRQPTNASIEGGNYGSNVAGKTFRPNDFTSSAKIREFADAIGDPIRSIAIRLRREQGFRRIVAPPTLLRTSSMSAGGVAGARVKTGYIVHGEQSSSISAGHRRRRADAQDRIVSITEKKPPRRQAADRGDRDEFHNHAARRCRSRGVLVETPAISA